MVQTHGISRGQFRFLEGQWYLELTPTYRFTRDGHALERFHEDRLKGIKRIEGNRAVLSSVLFWADYLRPKTTTVLRFQLGASVRRIAHLSLGCWNCRPQLARRRSGFYSRR